MKRIAAVVISLIALAALTGCGKNKNNNDCRQIKQIEIEYKSGPDTNMRNLGNATVGAWVRGDNLAPCKP